MWITFSQHSRLFAAERREKIAGGSVVDFFGVFADLEKALNFDESVCEESLIDWDRLRETVSSEISRCMETFEGIAIEDTRECFLSAPRRLDTGIGIASDEAAAFPPPTSAGG